MPTMSVGRPDDTCDKADIATSENIIEDISRFTCFFFRISYSLR